MQMKGSKTCTLSCFAFELGRQVANEKGYICWVCECLEGDDISSMGVKETLFFKHFFLLYRFILKSKREKF